MSNVRPPRRHMTHRHASAKLPIAKGAAAEVASGCPSAGGQRASQLSHRALSRSSARASEWHMPQHSLQRLEGLRCSSPWSLAAAFTFASHRRPNPSVKRTVNSGPRLLVFGEAVPLLPPLTSYVRPPRRLVLHQHASATLPIARGVVAEVRSDCPSFGGQRAIGLSHRALSRSAGCASESRMAQCAAHRLERHQHVLPWSLAEAFAFASHRRPNPSVKRTPNSGPRSAVFVSAVPLLVAAYLIR